MNYIAQIFAPIESLGMEIQTIQSAVAGVHRIDEFLAQAEKNVRTANEKPNENRPCVELRDVTFGYDGHNVLNHLSFQVQNGEQATLSGRTGAGKSTIFKLLMGLYEPQQGEVCIEGVPASAIPDEARRGLFGYVEQTFHRVPGTVRDQITLFRCVDCGRRRSECGEACRTGRNDSRIAKRLRYAVYA